MTRLPRKITYDLGRDRFGRKLELTVEGLDYILVREAANQRDETARLEISRDQARAIGDVAGEAL